MGSNFFKWEIRKASDADESARNKIIRGFRCKAKQRRDAPTIFNSPLFSTSLDNKTKRNILFLLSRGINWLFIEKNKKKIAYHFSKLLLSILFFFLSSILTYTGFYWRRLANGVFIICNGQNKVKKKKRIKSRRKNDAAVQPLWSAGW